MRKILSLMMMAMFSVAIFAATETTVYYTASEATIGTKTVKLNINRQGDADNWQQYNMTLTELTYNGDPVYTYTYTDLYDGVGKMQFQLYDGDNWVSEKEAISSWTSVAEYNGKMYVHATEQWVAAPGATGNGDQMYVWNGIGVTTAEAATELGGAAEAVQADDKNNIVAGASQKGNWCLKANKGFTNGAYYLGIAMNNGVNAGDTIKIAYFRTTSKNTYVLGMDFSADKASAATTYQILSQGDPQTLESNGTPADSIFIVPEGVANAKYMRIYRNTGGTGLWVAKVEVVKKAGETPEQPEEPEEVVLPVVKLAGSLTSWEEPVLMANAEDSLSASVTLNLGIDNYQLKVVSDGNWLSKAGDGDLYTMHRDWNHVDHLDLINTGDNIKLITDVAGEYTFTWTYADSTLVVTFPEAPAQPKFYITGNEDIVGEGNPTWGKNGALESFSDTLVMNLAAGFHKFKLITPAEQWLGMEALTDTAYGLFTDDDTNICFNIAEAGEVTVIYNATEFKVEGDFYIAPVANYYLIGDSAFVVDAGATADKAWTPDAIASFKDTTVLHLKAGVDYIMRLSLNGTWENHRDFRHLTDTAAGLIELPDEFGNHSIGFSLAEAGDVTIIYIPATNEQPEVFKLIGNFYVAPTPDPTVAVMGSMNDWAEEIPFVLSDDKTYASLTVENIGADEYEFKFVINGEWRSNGYRFHREFTGAAGITENNEANMVFVADQDGQYTFYWYFANDSAAIVYPEYIEPAKEYYAKYAPAWEWVKLTEAEGLWLTDTIVYKGIGININDKAADENNMFYSNTVEEEGVRPIAGPAIDVNDTIYFTFNPADSVLTAVMVGKYVAPVEETKDIVIVPGAWEGLHLGAWAWVDGEVGAWYPVVLDNEQLIATIPAAADRLIVATFAEGAELNWDNKINQTPDQVIDACGVLYINSNTPTWCEQGGFVEELYTIAGSGSILGVDWDQTAAINDMVFNAETGIYTLVKENLTLTAFEYQYKVAKDHVWNAGQYPASGNQVLAITEDGIYNVTFTFNPAIPLLTAEAEKIQDIVVEKHYLVVGQSMVANGEDWNNDTDINLMTTADEGLTYTLTVNGAELVADASYRYKIVEKGTWNEYFPNISGADASFTVEEDGIYTITYTYTVATSQCDVQATKTAELPEARLTDGYYIVGTFSAVDAWTVDDLTEAQRFVEYNTDEFGTYYSLTVDLAEGDQFKVVQVIHDAIVLWMPEGDGNNTVIDANHAGVAKNIYLNIMVNNTWDYSVEPNLYNGYYLLGTMNDWTPSADYMLGVDESCAEGELMLVTTFAQNDALKVAYVYNGVATQWYPGEGIADYVIDANHAGETSIYFRYDGQGSADWYYGFFYVIPLSHTDIDNVNAAGEATKILRDGQILIIKGEKMYNVMGQTIK